MPYQCPYCSVIATRPHNLRSHLMGSRPRGHGLTQSKADEIIESIDLKATNISAEFPTRNASSADAPGSQSRLLHLPIIQGDPVRDGHNTGLKMLENEVAVREALRLYGLFLPQYGVYLRIAERGLTVISLDYERCRSMIGVGGRDTEDVYLQALPPTIAQVRRACKGYEDKVRTLNRNSPEERFALECIHYALSNGCKLHGKDWFFILQEWRLPTGHSGDRLDILAVDVQSRELVVVELKRSEAETHSHVKHDRGAEGEAEYYAGILHKYRRDYYPFFERLARAMARIYGGPELMKAIELKPDHIPSTAVWVPPIPLP